MKKILFVLLFAGTITSTSFAQFEGASTSSVGLGSGWLNVGTGMLAYNMFETSQDAAGNTGAFGTNYLLPLQLQSRFDFFWGTQLAPRVLYTLLSDEAPDEGSSSRILLISAPIVKPLTAALKGSLGLGYMIRTIKGEGGTREVNNGLGTATFTLPGQSRSSKNILIEAGLSYQLGIYHIGLESLITSVLSSRRSMSLLLTLNYQLL